MLAHAGFNLGVQVAIRISEQIDRPLQAALELPAAVAHLGLELGWRRAGQDRVRKRMRADRDDRRVELAQLSPAREIELLALGPGRDEARRGVAQARLEDRKSVV